MSNPSVAHRSLSLHRNAFERSADAHPTPGLGHHVRMAVAELLLFLAQMVVTRRSEDGARLRRFVADYFRESARAEPLGGYERVAKIARAS